MSKSDIREAAGSGRLVRALFRSPLASSANCGTRPLVSGRLVGRVGPLEAAIRLELADLRNRQLMAIIAEKDHSMHI